MIFCFLQGLGGVVRKIVNEDLAENIWHPQHMDKIIPSLLYNIQIEDYKVFRHCMQRLPVLCIHQIRYFWIRILKFAPIWNRTCFQAVSHCYVFDFEKMLKKHFFLLNKTTVNLWSLSRDFFPTFNCVDPDTN